MPYRRDASLGVEVAEVAPDGSLVALDASGARGRDGATGAPGAHGGGSGARGQRGGDAGAAELGQSAGRIHVHLRPGSAQDDERLALHAELVLPAGERRRVEREVAFREGGFLDLSARGGGGGGGGHGGRGGDGATGAPGANATRHSSGGDGGRGGDGGDGGQGTSGASGGAGGQIVVEVDDADTHLLMLLRTDVRGGPGGRAGHNGAGGAAGAGGRGGSSYSWYETEREWDAQGKAVTRKVRHSNNGGESGPSGSPGSAGRAVLHEGAAGPDGRFEILVRDPAGQPRRYPDRYRLRLVSFEHVNENRDGIYEPGERVEVRRVVVANVGGMPTPSSRQVRVVLESDGWVWPERGQHLVVPPSLPPGHQAEVPGSLFFRIGDHRPEEPGDPFVTEDSIRQTAYLPAVHRAFEAYRPERDPGARYVIRYPLELSIIEGLPSVAPGEATRVRFAVRNVSQRAFGAASSLGRVLRLRLSVHRSELAAQHLALFDQQERPVDLARGWELELERLEPGAAQTFEGTIALAEDAPHFCAVTFWLALEVGRIDAPAEPRAIQYRDYTLRVARRYRRLEGLDLLLVVSHQTSVEEIAAWERLTARLGLTMTTWDPSIEGHLDLARDEGRGPLLEHLRGGTLVILDTAVSTPAGAVQPHLLLDRAGLRALVDAGIATLVLGGPEESVDLVRWLVPDEGAAPLARHPDADSFLRALREHHALDTLHEAVDLHHVGFWFEAPTEERLRWRAERLAERLQDLHPHRRFVVFCEHEPEVAAGFGVVKRWRMGRLRVRATLSSARSHLVHVAAPLGEFADVDRDPRLGEILLLARSFDEKLTRLAKALGEERDASAEVRALLVDLAGEVAELVVPGWRRGLSRAALRLALPLLHRAIERAGELGAPAPEAPHAAALLELFARLRYFARVQPRFWEWPLWPLRRSTLVRRVVAQLVDRWIEGAFGSPSTPGADRDAASAVRVADARRRVRAREQELATTERAAHAEAWGVSLTRHAHADRLLRHPLDWEGLTSDAELLARPAARVVDATALERIRRADDADRQLCLQVFDAWRKARADLARPRPVPATVPVARAQ